MKKLDFNSLLSKLTGPEGAMAGAFIVVAAQASHYFMLFSRLSGAGSEAGRITNAVFLTVVFAGTLFYFLLKAGTLNMQKIDKKQDYTKFLTLEKKQKKYRSAVILFAVLDAYINLFVWANTILIEPWQATGSVSLDSVLNFMAVLPVAIVIPVAQTLYAGEVMYKKSRSNKPVNGHSVVNTFFETAKIN